MALLTSAQFPIPPALGGAGSSTQSLHHPGRQALWLIAQQLAIACEVIQRGRASARSRQLMITTMSKGSCSSKCLGCVRKTFDHDDRMAEASGFGASRTRDWFSIGCRTY